MRNDDDFVKYKNVSYTTDQKQYFQTKIDCVKKKLLGYNPRSLMIETLNQSIHKNKNYLP